MPGDVDVGRAHLVARRQMGQGQWHVDVLCHQADHALVKAAHGVAQQPTEVGLPPILGAGQEVDAHVYIVRQTDQKKALQILILR
jgi:hypothetical protein